MTALRLFETDDVPRATAPEPEVILRAYCSWCSDFTVEPETDCCAICQRQRSTKYDYVEVGDDE